MTSRLTRGQLAGLFYAVPAGGLTGAVAAPEVITALYRLLGFDGQPVTAARLAAAAGRDIAAVEDVLERLPSIERDEHGLVVAFGGLTLRPTEHQLEVAGQVRHAWCAWDTLFLPVALGTTVTVRSCCPSTGQPITLTVTPAGIAERDPPTAVLSFVHPDTVDRTDLRASFCAAVHFLADASAAERWSAQHGAGLLILDLDDAFALGRRMIRERCGCSTVASDTGPGHRPA
jgi:alkylmercury lyase